jgi:secreted trypsin-like serine protease
VNLPRKNKIKSKNQRGQSLVEISLITPILLIALYIPADFGVALFMGNLTQNAAREGARIGSGLQKTGGTAPNLVYSSTEGDTVRTAVTSRMPAALTNKSVAVKFYTGTSCMEFIEVTAQGDYNFFLYQLMRLFGATVNNSIPISRTTQMRYNYQPNDNSTPCGTATVL